MINESKLLVHIVQNKMDPQHCQSQVYSWRFIHYYNNYHDNCTFVKCTKSKSGPEVFFFIRIPLFDVFYWDWDHVLGSESEIYLTSVTIHLKKISIDHKFHKSKNIKKCIKDTRHSLRPNYTIIRFIIWYCMQYCVMYNMSRK